MGDDIKYNIIFIPYRNREKHLEYFLEHSYPLLNKFIENLKIIIIEQGNYKLFNRGALFNIGFLEYESITNILFNHDVDINPTEKCIKEYYTLSTLDKNEHIDNKIDDNEQQNHIENIQNNIYSIYSDCITLGGIIKLYAHTFRNMNGFPNNYWGWGVEDKALQNRAEFMKYKINRSGLYKNKEINIEDYLKIFNDANDRICDNIFDNKTNFEYNDFTLLSDNEKEQHIQKSGLNNCTYTVIEKIYIKPNVEKIIVDFD